MFKSNRGQLSIFLGITLVLVMGMLAFIINVGLFVKAKINLQNAVDAAAFSGAAVQARQLTNIAYLNWEMRNNYKEWLFKYYVLGELSSLKPPAPGGVPFPLQASTPPGATGGFTDFRLKTGAASVAGMNISGMGGSGGPAKDKYNLASICLHNSAATDICPSYVIPGLPRFPAIGVAGISEIHETFVTNLVAEKAKNCTNRSAENFNAALIWAFGEGETPTSPVPPHMPAILAAQRPGAWPKAVELAMRMRNLEMIVNLPPKGPITSANAPDLTGGAGADFSLNERPYKAFMSAFKNLGGGINKDGKDGRVDELSREFKLTELEPNVQVVQRESLSGFLIPQSADYALKKYYLDLQAMPLNLATMFSTFTTTITQLDPTTQSEGTCGISKTAMPVPGFILGFVKNPEVMTYYAVKGESKFIGLFSPFRGTNHESGVPLVAYAAAKPFGGRIGPKLFAFEDNNKVKVRNDTSTRSLSYISGLQIPSTTTPFNPGDPIPVSPNFWIHAGVGAQGILGGVPGSSNVPYFGLPNMIYDYVNISRQKASGGAVSGQVVDIMDRTSTGGFLNEKLGLYDPQQYNLLKKSLDPDIVTALASGTGSYDSKQILNSIVKARRPTRYDAVNYLVPDWKHTTPEPTNAIPYITEGPLPTGVSGSFVSYKIFAPLMGEGLLYNNLADLENVLVSYIASMASAVETYEKALLEVANSIADLETHVDVTGTNSNTAAAKGIHIGAGTTDSEPTLLVPGTPPANCPPDIASKFHYFFSTNPAASGIACKVEPLKVKMIKFINNIASTSDPNNPSRLYSINLYYTGTSDAIDQEKLFTGYNPGHRQGVLARKIRSAISGGTVSGAMRNYYSTKFFRMAQITEGTAEAVGSLEPSLREEKDKAPDDLVDKQIKPKNLLKKADLTPVLFFSYF